jgi:hypothetical protein
MVEKKQRNIGKSLGKDKSPKNVPLVMYYVQVALLPQNETIQHIWFLLHVLLATLTSAVTG